MNVDPFAKLYQLDSWVVKRSPLYPFSARAGFLVAAAVILGFWFAVERGFRLLFPATSFAIWLSDNWGWALIGTAVVYVGYSFCRTFLETKTTISGSEAG